MIRKPIVSGTFYSSDPVELKDQIEKSYKSKFGPKELPVNKRKENTVFSLILPHAGYYYSGPCAAIGYNKIGNLPETIIILGTDHSNSGTFISVDDWQTPLGIIKTNQELAKRIINECEIKKSSLEDEHSIEMQIPFIQHLMEKQNKIVEIIAIKVANDIDFKNVSKKLYEITSKESVMFIVSSDFTHAGKEYYYTPFKDIKKEIYEQDNKIIEYIIKKDTESFNKYLNKTNATVCGRYAIELIIEITKLANKNGKLLKYYTSGDISCDYSSAVGYATIIFE